MFFRMRHNFRLACRLAIVALATGCLSTGLQAVDFTVPGGGSVTGSTSHAEYPPALAFDDGGDGQEFRWLPFQSELPNVFIQYDFGKPVLVTTYMIQNQHFDFEVRSPKDWKLQGSNDGTVWTDVDTVSGEVDWTEWEKRLFTVDTPGLFRHYKLVFSAATGSNDYMGFGEIELGMDAEDVPPASWSSSHLTGDADSGVDSSLTYTTAVSVNGTSDKVVNGVTFKANTGTSGTGWEITENFHKLHAGETSTVGGTIGEVLSDGFRYDGNPQKLKLTGLTPGYMYAFSFYSQAWGATGERFAELSLDDAPGSITLDQQEFMAAEQDGQLVQCRFLAVDSDVEFTATPTDTPTWHLYAFSNAEMETGLLPSIRFDSTNATDPVVTLHWESDVTEFTLDDIGIINATANNFQEVNARMHTFNLVPDANKIDITITIGAATLKVGGADNEAFHSTYHYSFSTLPSIQVDGSDPNAQLVTLEWLGNATGFTVDDLVLANATASNFQEVDARKHTFTLAPGSNRTTISITIGAATLQVSGGDNEEFSHSFDHYHHDFIPRDPPLTFFTEEIGHAPVVWYDAGDVATITGTSPVTQWEDKSGNDRHATSPTGAPAYNATGGRWGSPVVELRKAGGDDYMEIGGTPFFAKEHYYVFRSSDAADRWDYFGAVLGHQNGRNSNYLFENNNRNFHGNQSPEAIQQNGLATTGNVQLSQVNQFMILRISVNDNDTSPKDNYRIGRADNGFSASLDIAEIIAFDTKLPPQARQKLEGYLARKWGLVDRIDANHPYRSEPPVITMTGDANMRLALNGTFTDPGATATDPEDGDLDTITMTYHAPPSDPQPLEADTYPGLQLWLKADEGFIPNGWSDQSFAGNDATAHGDPGPQLIEDAQNGLPVMRYSGTVGEYHGFQSIGDIRTVFWVVKRNTGMAFLLGHSGSFHFHSKSGDIFESNNNVHQNIRDGRLAINGSVVNVQGTAFPPEMSVLSLRTTGNVQADSFSNDRNSAGRYWNGDLAELLIYNTALTDIEMADIEARLGYKWGLPYTPVSLPLDNLDSTVLGDWTQIYTATDSTGHAASVRRTIRVFDPDAPVITLVGGPEVQHEQGATFTDPGYTLSNEAGDSLDVNDVTITGTVEAGVAGTYELSYDFIDPQGRPAETVFRTVEVSDTLPPVITLTGGDSIKHPLGQPFVDPGFSAVDLAEGILFVSNSLYTNGIWHQGFTTGNIETLLNFNENGGLLQEVPVGENLLLGAINFNGDQEFMDAGVGLQGRNDNFNNLFTGWFAAKKSGTYQFQIAGRDDRGSFWVDLDRNGVFEANGSAGSEWMNNGYVEGISEVRLDPGFYRYAVGHNEGSGGSRIIARFTTPEGAGPTTLANVDPTQPNQEGLWVLENPFNTGELGTHTITYTSVDSLGHMSTATRTVEVIDATALPVITLVGRAIMKHEQYTDFVDPGYSVADADGNPLDASSVEVSGFFDTNAPGVYELLYTFYDDNGIPADPVKRVVEVLDTTPPTVTLLGDAEIEHTQGTPFTDPGATHEVDPDGDLFVVSTAQFPAQGLWLHADASNMPGLEPGDQVLSWLDVSGQDNHLSNVRGDPQLVADGINGRPAVRVDGDDFLAMTKDSANKYSIFTVSRWREPAKGRLMSSFNRNWLLGYHNGKEDTFLSRNWASLTLTNVTTDPHIYIATSTGNTHVQFWGDRRNLTTDTKQNEPIGKFQVGGYSTATEPASGDVAEVLIYNNYVVTEEERLTIEGMLAIKYGLLGYPQQDLPDLSKVGEHTIHYAVQDAAGNVGFATRKVTVLPDPEIPIITLVGDQVIHHEATTTFTDPGVTIKDGNGQDLDAGLLVVGGSVDVSVQGLHVLTYNYTTAGGKVAQEVIRHVIVRDTTGPDLTLLGDAEVRLQVGDTYTDTGLTANDALDGDLDIYKETDIPAAGLLLHLDAGTFVGTLADGDLVTSWPDISGQGNDADNTFGDPTWLASGPNGRPVVNFDGNDLIWTTKNFESDLENFTMISIARYTGGANNRVIAARSANFAFGFHGNRNQQFLLDGWVSNHGGVDTLWHLHVGDINNQDRANFWVDGIQRATNSTNAHNTNYKPDQIQLGGWRTQNEMSKAEVAELLVYNRVISEEERNTISAALNSKYGFQNGGFGYVRVDTSAPGTHNIRYRVADSTGNYSEATRTVIVTADTNLPFIVMNGDAFETIEAASNGSYTDPGAVAKASDGTILESGLAGVGEVDVMTPGIYILTYNFTDSSNNVAETATRTIQVADTLRPEITLAGEDPLKFFVDTPFQDPGGTSTDLLDGEIPVYSHYLSIPDTLRLEYHVQGSDIANLYLANGGGVLGKNPYRTLYFTDGFHGDGINFHEREDFPSYTEVLRNDHYQLIFSGLLNARRDGTYGFSASKLESNDYCTIWVDRDQDGVLERNGDRGDEQVIWDNQVNTLHLDQGEYWVVIGYSQWNTLSAFNAKFHTPEGVGPSTFTTIHPGGPGQEGLWRTKPRAIDTSVPGQHTITYFADDLSGNRSTVTRQVVVEEDTMKPVILLLGDKGIEHHAGFPYKDAGVLLEDFAGNPLDESLVVTTGMPTGFELGEFTIVYNYTDGDGHIAEMVTRNVLVHDIVAPVITLNGSNPATVQLGHPYIDAGGNAVDAFDGPVALFHNMGFNRDGLVLHLDAASFEGTLNDGDTIAIPWQDLSGNGNHADNQVGNPTWKASVLNGLPVVDFDGDDVIFTTKDFEPDLANYSIYSIARYTSGSSTNRVISTSGASGWLLGYHGNTHNRFHSGGGWVYIGGGRDTAWHIHAGNANNQDQANFWVDGAHLAKNSNAFDNTNYKPHDIVLGGWDSTRERSKCQVAELILFNRVIEPEEHEYIQMYLQGKYNLLGGSLLPPISPIDTSIVGEYTIAYATVDSNGNIARATRTVNVVNEPNLPVITLIGDSEAHHPTGQPYVDEGAIVATAQGAPLDASGLIISDGVNADHPGEYVYSYDFTDGNGNKAATAVRTVIVTDQTPPSITLFGEETIIHQLGNRFTDPGYTATDLVDGTIHVESSMLKVDRIRLRGYMQSYNESQVDLDGNGGILNFDPVGERTDYGGSTYFNGDGAFQSMIPQITRVDHFQFVMDGHFHTASGGTYEFGMEQPDERAGFWIDLDGDGVFEAEGDKGSELMNPGFVFGYREIELSPGYHYFAIAHAEHGSGSRLDARYRAIIGEGPGQRAQIDPSHTLQKGQWNIYNPIDVLAPGEHTITYTATDSAGNVGTATRTVIVRNNPDAGIITLNGEEVMTIGVGTTFTDPEATVTDIDGQVLSNDNLVITGTVDTSKLGEYFLEYNYSTDAGVPSRSKIRTVLVADLEPPVITLNGDAEVTVLQGAVYVDEGATALDNLDGEFVVLGTSEHFPEDGLFTHLDADTIGGKSTGDAVTLWYDRSSAGNNADDVTGTPSFVANSIHGRPAVHFDGSSLMALRRTLSVTYSVISVSKLAPNASGRLISSKDQNWLFGYHEGFQDRFHVPNGWVTSGQTPATNLPQLYSATSGERRVKFFANGKDMTAVSSRRDDNYSMGVFQMGGYQNGLELSSGDISEIIIYDRVLTNTERMSIEARLNAKYGLNGVESVTAPVDTSTLGEYHVVYQSVDSAGNVSSKMRKVTVVKDPAAPSLALVGDDYLIHEAGETFTDPGATLLDAQGDPMAGTVDVTSDLDPNLPGIYTITYSYNPDPGTPAPPVSRTVEVRDTQGPVITLLGDEVVKLAVGATYEEEGATSTDLATGSRFVLSKREYTLDQLDLWGYQASGNDALLNLAGADGLFNQNPVEKVLFINGPGNRGMQYYSDGEIRDPFEKMTNATNYQTLYHGVFIPPVSGTYSFDISRQDDQVSIWLDLDQDGQFEAAGDKGNEQLRDAGQAGLVSVDLDYGVYKFAIAFRQGGSGAAFYVHYQVPGEDFANIQPGIQPFQWASQHAEPFDTSTAGTFTIDYQAWDPSGNVSTATRTVVVVDDSTIPFIALNGGLVVEHELGATFTDPEAVVRDADGSVLKSDLKGEGTVDANTLGTYTLTYDYTDGGTGKVAEQVTRTIHVVDTIAPVVTLTPHPNSGGTDTVELTVGDTWEDPGIDIADADGSTWFVSSRNYIPNRLFHAGFQDSVRNANLTNFENGGGFLSMTPGGSAIFTTGPEGNGFNYANDADFRFSPIGITNNDWYGSYVMGYFHARVQGDYTFQSDGDNHMAIWLDQDMDGVFSGFEQVVSGLGVQTATVTLDEGYYLYAGAHYEANSISYARLYVQTPAGAGPETLEILKPAAPSQAGLWNMKGDGPIDTTFPGTHTITYYAFDSTGHLTRAIRTVVVNEDPDAPVLTLVGDAEIHHQVGTDYTEVRPTIAAADGTPINDQASIVPTITGPAAAVDKDLPGTYEIHYDYTDGNGKKAIPVLQTVIVGDFLAPVITLLGDNPYYLTPGYTYIDPGATANDTIDGDLTVSLPPLDFSTASEATLHLEYTVTDAAGNTATAIRELIIRDDPNRSIIVLTDGKTLTHEAGEVFVDPGFTLTNGRGHDLDESGVTVTGSVDHTALNTYTLEYSASGASTILREVTVVDTTPPEILLTDGEYIRINVGATYVDPGYTVTDNLDENLVVSTKLQLEGLAPIALWDFNESDGNIANELINDLDGELFGFPDPKADSWVQGKYGNALKFENGNSSYIKVTGSELLDLQQFTISVWVLSDDYNRGMFLFEKTKGNIINSQYNLYFDDNDTIKFRTFGTDGSDHLLQPTAVDLTQNDWNHVVATYDGENKSIYVNGELLGTETHDATLQTDENGPIYIGAWAPGDGYFYQGLMDDLKIYGQAFEEGAIPELAKQSGVDTSEVKKDPYKVVYSSTDSSGNSSDIIRHIVVSNDTTPPTISLIDLPELQVDLNSDFVDPGATANDNQDGDISAKIVYGGTVDTSKSGVYTLTYDVTDLSYNAATQVTRTVTVGTPGNDDPLDVWTQTHLSTLPADQQLPLADPDADGLENLLEYALGGNPTDPNNSGNLQLVTDNDSFLSVTFLRLKDSVDSDLNYKVELTNNIGDETSWSTDGINVTVDVDQSGVPANYEKVTATSSTPIASVTEGRQFIRITVDRD